MPDELEALLRLVAEGRLTADEAAPIVAALERRNATGGDAQNPSANLPDSGPPSVPSDAATSAAGGRAHRRKRGHLLLGTITVGGGTSDAAREARDAARDARRRAADRAAETRASARDTLAGRRLRIYVGEHGRPVVNLQIPLAAAGYAIDNVPGLSPDVRSRVVEAIRTGMTGPILEVDDEGDEVRIVIE